MFSEEQLVEVLIRSQQLGFLGARPIDEVIAHADVYVTALGDLTGVVVDLGAGGGVPGLVLAQRRPDLQLVLVDRRTKRTDFLERMVRRCGLGDRIEVCAQDTADLIEQRSGAFDGAIARGFGPPMQTLSTGLALVRPGGRVVISEPPAGDRWDVDMVAEAGGGRRDGPLGVAVFERLR